MLVSGNALLVPVALIGSLAALLPGFLIYWKMILAPTIVILENQGVLQALQRSWALTRGMMVRGLGVFFLGVACFLPVSAWSAAFDQPQGREIIRDFLSFAPRVVADSALVLAGLALDALSVSFWGVLLTVFYVETRVRREAFDLAVRLKRRGRGSEAMDRASQPTAWAGRA
jgi:hypothetical protein